MANYGLKYICTFDSIEDNQSYKVELLFKDYEGFYFNLTGASTPVVHSFNEDNPKAIIKGSSINFTFLNEGQTPVTNFYSEEDDGIKLRLYWGSQLMFEGYIVQDDCQEIMVDYTHEISLSANDGLGLLRDISLDKAYKPGLNPLQTTTDDIYAINTLLDLIKHCIYSTGLQLHTYIYSDLREINETNPNDKTFLDKISIDLLTFTNDFVDFESCYTVLEKVLGRFNFTLFQSKGAWAIVRFDELRYYLQGQIIGYEYDETFTLVGTTKLIDSLNFGISNTSYGITGMVNRVQRPYKFDKETFNYKFSILLKNADLKILGDLITTYTIGVGVNLQTIKEYNMPYWFDGPFAPHPQFFIRIVYDYLNNEIDRYAVVKGASGSNARSVTSSNVEMDAGEQINISFDFRVSNNDPGNTNKVFALTDYNGSILRYLHEDGTWQIGVGILYNIPSGDNGNQWHTVDVTSQALPFSGVVNFFLGQQSGTNAETHYKNIKLEISSTVAQTHLSEQDLNIKNNKDIEIFIDDSPKNTINGALFLTGQTVGIIKKRTLQWSRGRSFVEALRLGNITTFETLFWRRITRTIYEGSIRGLVQSGNHLSIATLVKNDENPTLNLIFGKLDIDYRNNTASGTLYEVYDDGEVDTDLTSTYTFEYIYKV
jgi:hypothetical protein